MPQVPNMLLPCPSSAALVSGKPVTLYRSALRQRAAAACLSSRRWPVTLGCPNDVFRGYAPEGASALKCPSHKGQEQLAVDRQATSWPYERSTAAGNRLFVSQLWAEGDAGCLHGGHLLLPEPGLAFQPTPFRDLIPFLGRLIEGSLWRHRLL